MMMNCSTLPASGMEDNITDDMLELYMEQALISVTPSDVHEVGALAMAGCVRGQQQRGSCQSNSLSLPHGSPMSFALGTVRNPRHSKGDLLVSGSSMGLESMEDIVFERQSRRTSVQQRPLLESETHEDDASDITSDDSGDFAFFTDGVRDAAVYDTIRDYVVYGKQQEKDLEELEEECARLEAEQQLLYGTAVAAKLARGSTVNTLANSFTSVKSKRLGGTLRSGGVNEGGGDSTGSSARGGGGVGGGLPDLTDEFAECGVDPLRACPGLETQSGAPKGRTKFRYGEPDVVGDYAPVFKSGFLYRCATPEGLWVFYNDSHKYQMQVRYVFGASSTLAAGPHATLRRLPSGEVEITVTVWPQETEVLLQGEVNGFKNLSVASPVDARYVNPHTSATTADAAAVLVRCARQCGKSSVAMLTTADVLECCLATEQKNDNKKKKNGAATSTAAAPPALHFVDPAFPPSRASLYRAGVDDAFLWDMPWRRPSSYLPPPQSHEACLFAGASALPTDPSPGDGGDAYLCSAAALLAEEPARVARLFRHPTSTAAGRAERGVGAYAVTLGHGGWWTTTVIDSYLPASLKGPDMGRCLHDQRKLWYPLLEKAYAKLHGAYAAIQFGDPLEALQDFTGFPTFRFDEEWAEVVEDVRLSLSSYHTSPETEGLFDMLTAKVNECGYDVCLSLPDEGPAEAKLVQMGMVYGMSYAVLRLVHYERYRLVQVRCPTMRLDGDGLWCTESVRWRQEPELARLCGMSGDEEDADDLTTTTPGGLWLDWSEALVMFEGGGVCCTQDTWTEDCRVRGTFHDGIPSFVLEVFVDSTPGEMKGGVVEAYCVLSQEDDRGLPPDHPNRALQPLMLCLSSALELSDIRDSEATLSASISAHQCLRLACSTDPDKPTDQLSYILGRETALRTTLEPSVQPYYIIPRCLGEMSSKLFTVGIVSATPVTKGGKLRVRAVQLPPSSPVFKNQRIFSVEAVTNVAATSFQLRGADGRVRVGCGSTIG